jgi:ribosomal protein S6--L-glutamate ligase
VDNLLVPEVPTILVLSRQPEAYSVRRLKEAAARRSDLELRLVDPHALCLQLEGGRPQASIAGAAGPESLPQHCVVIPRIGSTATEFSLAALEQLELCGIPALCHSSALHLLRNKFSALSYLGRAGLPVPDSAMLRGSRELTAVVEQLGGYPVVLKFIRGSQGLGVVYAADETAALSVLEALNFVQYDVMLQRYYPGAAQLDTRVLVLGGRARWAVRRQSSGGRFRSNFHRGGAATPLELTPELASLAERAVAAACPRGLLSLAGVDIIEWPDSPLILEVNASPGFETIEAAHEADVAGAILETAAGLLTPC